MSKKSIIFVGVLALGALGILFVANPKSVDDSSPSSIAGEKSAVSEGGALDKQRAATQLVGIWQSTDDSQSVREFTSDGRVVESYDKQVMGGEGTWELLTLEEARSAEIPNALTQAIYLLIDTDEFALSFIVNELDAEKLSLIYLDRGTTLEYTRVFR